MVQVRQRSPCKIINIVHGHHLIISKHWKPLTSGLAEFGLVVDDGTKSKDFNTQYFEPRWNQLLGTKEKPGLVTGSSRLAAGCPWKEKLPARPKPWSDILLVLAYGDKAYINLAPSRDKWLTNIDSVVKSLDVRSFSGKLGGLDKVQWTFRSQLGDGSTLAPDPLAGTCVKYGDKVFLQANNEDIKWLSGGRSSGNQMVLPRNHRLDETKSSYQWTVRSSPGDGLRSSKDSNAGQCVSEKSLIYLQVNSLDHRWLMGSSTSEVHTKDHGASDTGGKEYYKWIVEMSPDNLGTKCWHDYECDSGRCSKDWICKPKLPAGESCLMVSFSFSVHNKNKPFHNNT